MGTRGGRRGARGLAVMAAAVVVLAACTSPDDDTEVMGVQLTATPDPDAAASPSPADGPTPTVQERSPAPAPTPSPTPSPTASPAATSDDPGSVPTGGSDPSATAAPTATSAPAPEPSPSPTTTASPTPSPGPTMRPVRLAARDADVGTTWAVVEEDGRRWWVEASSSTHGRRDEPTFTIGLAEVDDPDGSAPQRDAVCSGTLGAPEHRRLEAEGEITVELVVDGRATTIARIPLRVELEAGQRVDLPEAEPRRVALSEVDEVSCRARFIPTD